MIKRTLLPVLLAESARVATGGHVACHSTPHEPAHAPSLYVWRKGSYTGDVGTLLSDGRPFEHFSLICVPASAGLEYLFP